MKYIKTSVAFLLVIAISVCVMGCSFGISNKKPNTEGECKLNIMTSIFPYYDVVKHIVADTPGVKVDMAVEPGKDSHSFEPTPADIKRIDGADILFYNGGSMETWLSKVLESLDNKKQKKVCLMESIDQTFLIGSEETADIYANPEEEEDEDEVEIDEHIWTNPMIMYQIADIVCNIVSKELPQYKDYFESNRDCYKKDLLELDSKFKKTVKDARYDTMIFADKFPLVYFAKEYRLKFYAAFPGCSGDTEPSAHTVAFLIDKIESEKVNAIFCLELSSHMVADSIGEDTGARVLQFNSCHMITQKQFDKNVSYIDLMNENVKKLSIALDSERDN